MGPWEEDVSHHFEFCFLNVPPQPSAIGGPEGALFLGF